MSPTIRSQKIQENDIIIHILVSIYLLVFLIQLALVYSLYLCFPSLQSRQFLCSVFLLSFKKQEICIGMLKAELQSNKKRRGEGLRSRRQRDELPVFKPMSFFIRHLYVFVPFFPLSCEPEQIFYLLCISCRLLLRVTFMLYITILWRRGDVSSLAILQ